MTIENNEWTAADFNSENLDRPQTVAENLKEQTTLQNNSSIIEHKMHVQLIQPWSVPVFKTTLPPDILQTMIEISDQSLIDKESKKAGPDLAGQINNELYIDLDILEKAGVAGFFLDAVRQFIITCKSQSMPSKIAEIQQEEWSIQMQSCWIVFQQPGEYNPLHWHGGCQITAIMYLKIPEILPSRKNHRSSDDASIIFTGNASRDVELSMPSINIFPRVGDFYIMGSHQQHAVYPYRCAEGQEDVERRSISFNAEFQHKEKEVIKSEEPPVQYMNWTDEKN
jgi:hypothetical protein